MFEFGSHEIGDSSNKKRFLDVWFLRFEIVLLMKSLFNPVNNSDKILFAWFEEYFWSTLEDL